MIGVLALQGGFIEHVKALRKLGADNFEIRKQSDLDVKNLSGLILPGGESTVIGKLLHETGLFDPIDELIRKGVPVFGTCAGLILLAERIENDRSVYFGAINITAKRNAYGRQLGSFRTEGDFDGVGKIPMTFIRAPYIEETGDGVKILSRVKGRIVAARQKNVLVTAFHPELTNDLRVHEYFLKKF
ncbi:MAG: pyridoxal 5'-phosphate synthase glutaminase subunit PdxT [Bacillota bacterium]|nr:pyridoxal 5'-phosphate synthase glutaminase subunit PdxT [Bacillota bacterium]